MTPKYAEREIGARGADERALRVQAKALALEHSEADTHLAGDGDLRRRRLFPTKAVTLDHDGQAEAHAQAKPKGRQCARRDEPGVEACFSVPPSPHAPSGSAVSPEASVP